MVENAFGAALGKTPQQVRAARFNVSPGQMVLVLRSIEGRGKVAEAMRWGFDAPWKKGGGMVINARRESLESSRLWRPLLENEEQRCLIPADGFYEWRSRGAGRPKQPYLFELADGGPFVFAGLWRGGSGDEPPECVIVTCEANDLVAGVHDRMPVMLRTEEAEQWVAGDDGQAQAALRPLDSTAMRVRPVSTSVNSSRRDDPDLLTELVELEDDGRGHVPESESLEGASPSQDSLFAD